MKENVPNFYKEYLEYTKEIQKRTDSNTAICLYQYGSFSEIYTSDEKFAARIADLLQMSYGTKSQGIFMIGWPKISDPKYISILLNAHISVGIVEQITSERPYTRFVDRTLVKVVTPQTDIESYTENTEQFSHVVYINRTKNAGLFVGVNSIDLSTGSNIVEQHAYSDTIGLLNKISQLKYSANTITTFVHGDAGEVSDQIRAAGHNVKVIDQIINQAYIEDALRRVFGGSNVPLQQKLNISNLPNACIAFVLNLDLIYRMNPRILSNVEDPKLRIDDDLLFNASLLHDIHILPPRKTNIDKAEIIFGTHCSSHTTSSRSILELFQKCCTHAGNREMRKRLLKPTSNSEKLIESFSRIREMTNCVKTIKDCFRCHRLVDPERKYRRLQIQTNKNLSDLKEIFHALNLAHALKICLVKTRLFAKDFDELAIEDMQECITNVITFDDPECFIKPNQFQYIDELRANLKMSQEKVERIITRFSGIIGTADAFKLDATGRDKNFSFQCTPKRAAILKASQSIVNITNTLRIVPKELTYCMTRSKNACTISSPELDSLLLSLKNDKDMLDQELQTTFNDFVETFLKDHDKQLKRVINNITQIDVYSTICKVSNQNAFYIPELAENLRLEELRHPLIPSCVSNNVRFEDKSQVHLVTGLNSSGKSTLGRSVTLALYTAHCGIPTASKLTFKPLKNIFTRISGQDDLNNSLSSFDYELLTSKFIIDHLDQNTFVFGDELYASSEQSAILCLNAAFITLLLRTSSKAILTTHCHELKNICNLKTSITFFTMATEFQKNGAILFKRKLLEGDCDVRYGLQCASALFGATHPFIKEASQIERRYLDKRPDSLVPPKRSRYNSTVVVDSCAICNVTTETHVLETHHIMEQNKFDDQNLNGFVKKNSCENLVVLCAKCHDLLDVNKLIIHGWEHTSIGKQLNYEIKT